MADKAPVTVRLTGREFKLDKDQLVLNRADIEQAISTAGLKPGGPDAARVEVEVSVKVKF